MFTKRSGPPLRFGIELAEDLGRFLEGEPIRARAPSLSYRLSKKARKHGTIIMVSALAVILFVSFLTYVVYSQWKSSRQAELAQQFGQEVKEIENILRFADRKSTRLNSSHSQISY